jgi:hypothetical protein
MFDDSFTKNESELSQTSMVLIPGHIAMLQMAFIKCKNDTPRPHCPCRPRTARPRRSAAPIMLRPNSDWSIAPDQ